MADEEARATQSKLSTALPKLVDMAQLVELPMVAELLNAASLVLGHEAAGFRIPRCPTCHDPRHDHEVIARVNRDRV